MTTPAAHGEPCKCERPHYPLEFFRREGQWLATRGTKPVWNILADGWERAMPSFRIEQALREQYNASHRFDWLHTPTYLDDKETHLRMKAETSR